MSNKSQTILPSALKGDASQKVCIPGMKMFTLFVTVNNGLVLWLYWCCCNCLSSIKICDKKVQYEVNLLKIQQTLTKKETLRRHGENMTMKNQAERFFCIVSRRVGFPFGTAAGSVSVNEKEAFTFG